MSDIPQPKSNKEEPEPTDAKDDSLVVNPINIARARHASAHGQSVVDQAKQTVTRKMQVTSPPASAKSASASNRLAETIAGNNGCLFVSLLGMAFMVGGIIGGLVGGGLLLSVSSERVALWSEPVTPTPSPTPTSVPVETLTPTPSPQPSPTPAMEDIIAEIIPSVVTIINQQNLNLSFRPEDGRVVGSGVIVDGRGYVATNNHVVEGARELRVVLADGRDVPAELIVADPTEDLAVIKITADNILPIKWGDSSSVRPGQSVYAIGSPLGDFPSSVSFGIVSGLNRALEMDEHVIDGLIQTDAAINRGSSGGPLINIQGEMIGINTFIIRESEDRGVAEGIAFALPTYTAKDILFPWIAAHSGESVPIPAGESN